MSAMNVRLGRMKFHRSIQWGGGEGATLIELIVALVVLTAGLLPLLLALNRIYINSYKLGVRSEATLLAAERIDDLKSQGFLAIEMNTLAGKDSALINEGALSQKPYFRVTELRYQKSLTGADFVDAGPSDIPTDYIKLTSTVSWFSDYRLLNRTLTTMMTRQGSFD